MLASIEGRDDDVLVTREGRRIGRLDPVFKSVLPLREAQIVQETLERVRVRYLPAPGFGENSARTLIEELRARLGPMEIVLEAVDSLPRTSTGKFRAVVSQLSPEDRDRAAAAR